MRRNYIFVFTLFFVNACTWNQAAACPRQEKTTTDSSAPDTTVVLFEDLFGRWRDGTAATLGFSRSGTTSELLGVSGSNRSSQSNTTFVSGVVGDRRTYQLTVGLTNVSPDQTQQQYNLAADFRPSKSFQATAEIGLTRIQEPMPFNSYRLAGGVTYLTKGLLQYQPEQFAFYYHFSELVLDRGTTLISILPHYNDAMEDDVSATPSQKEWGGPISIALGLWKNSTLTFAGDYSRSTSELTSPANLLNANVGSISTVDNMTSTSYSAGLVQRLSDHFLFSAASEWTSVKTGSDYSTNIVGSPSSAVSTDGKQTYYSVSAGLSTLYLDQPVSIGDLRRSSYNGIYLRVTEWKNRFQFSFMSPSNPLSQSVSLVDNFSYGIVDHLELEGRGGYAFARRSTYSLLDAINGWKYSVGLTLHNLNFNGNELSDYDFFWGRITEPGDYVAGILWRQEQDAGNLMPKTGVVSLRLQTAVITHTDVVLIFSNTFIHHFGTEEVTAISALLRADVAGFIRVQLALSHNGNSVDARAAPNGYQVAEAGGIDYSGSGAELRVNFLF
jgi:hypothetical protein